MVSTLLSSQAIHADTQAVLLLCATFSKGAGHEPKPLTLAEYNALASWLLRQRRRPADLLRPSGEPVAPGEAGLPATERVRALLGRGVQLAVALEQWQRLGLWVISRGEERYPERLRRHLRSAAPPLLYGAGDVTRLNLGGLAVVGSRDVDEAGLAFTRRVAERCPADGVQVISGGARGIDQASVAAALAAGGGAVAVLAERLDRAATSREAKEPLRDGRLTLLSPYEPEGGFTVGKAMGRNKHIYALADFALVVRFTTGEGGTWAGATEQLGRNKSGSASVPVFVCAARNPEDGYRELLNRGALPFPEEEVWKGNVTSVLRRSALPPTPMQVVPASGPDAAEPSTDGPSGAQAETAGEPGAPLPSPVVITSPAAPPEPAPAVPEADACYNRCLPLLLEQLRTEPSERQLPAVAKRLGLVPQQFRAWLKRAMAEGKVAKKDKGRRRVYATAPAAMPDTLFDRGGDAA